LDSGRPFAPFMPAARARIATMGATMGEGAKTLGEDLEALAPFAARGVPTPAALVVRAGALRLGGGPTPEKEAPAPATDAGLWARVKAQIAGLVTIRRVDEANGNRAEGGQPDLASVRAALAAG